MTNPDPKAGGWAGHERLTSPQMNLVRQGIIQSPDVVNGGTYTPAGPVIINGPLSWNFGDYYGMTSRAVTRRLVPYAPTYNATNWTPNFVGYWTMATTTPDTLNMQILDLPHGSRLDSVTVKIKGNTGHGVSAPGGMPTLAVFRSNGLDTTATQLGSTSTDTYGSSSAYQTLHSLTVGTISHTVDRSANIYYCAVTNEQGANSIAGCIMIGISVICTVDRQDGWY